MKRLIVLIAIFGVALPANAETFYLVIKSKLKQGHAGGLALISISMETMEMCEEVGATIVSSTRFDLPGASLDAFDCVKGR